MPRGRKPAPIDLAAEQRAELEAIVRCTTNPHALVQRARMILASAEGVSNPEVARRIGCSVPAVSKWRRRFFAGGVDALADKPRPGRPRIHDDDDVAAVISRALTEKPAAATHWSVRSMAEAAGVPKTTVHRWFSDFGVRPHLTRTFKLSNDPDFVAKVTDIVGLYLHPPENALVLCVDEKSQIQALERSQPALPMGLGYVEGFTHDYFRHGTTTLFAALDVATGRVIAKCQRRHRHQEFLSFLRLIDREVPPDLDVHIVLDNYSTHRHHKVAEWLSGRERYHLHFTPTYSSWLNQVERWFALISQRAIKRGSFTSVPQLVGTIDEYVQRHNADANPFNWVATAESIIGKVKRIALRINGTGH